MTSSNFSQRYLEKCPIFSLFISVGVLLLLIIMVPRLLVLVLRQYPTQYCNT